MFIVLDFAVVVSHHPRKEEATLFDPVCSSLAVLQPVLHQSVDKAVGREGSNVLTPCLHWSTTSCLEALNATSSSGDQKNDVLLDRRCLKGSKTGLVAKE